MTQEKDAEKVEPEQKGRLIIFKVLAALFEKLSRGKAMRNVGVISVLPILQMSFNDEIILNQDGKPKPIRFTRLAGRYRTYSPP